VFNPGFDRLPRNTGIQSRQIYLSGEGLEGYSCSP